MKRQWDIEELIEQFTLVPDDLNLLGNKTGATRLGFAVLLKYLAPNYVSCHQGQGKLNNNLIQYSSLITKSVCFL